MKTKFSEDVISLSDLEVNPGKIVNRKSYKGFSPTYFAY